LFVIGDLEGGQVVDANDLLGQCYHSTLKLDFRFSWEVYHFLKRIIVIDVYIDHSTFA